MLPTQSRWSLRKRHAQYMRGAQIETCKRLHADNLYLRARIQILEDNAAMQSGCQDFSTNLQRLVPGAGDIRSPSCSVPES